MAGTDSKQDFDGGAERPPRVLDSGQLVATLYAELRALAQTELQAERRNHTLSATALVNEVYLKMAGAAERAQPSAAGPVTGARMLDRAAFFGAAAQAMRRILVDHARAKRRLKRGGGEPVAGGDALHLAAPPDDGPDVLDALGLDEALTRLAAEHAEAAQVVELRFFAGLTEAQSAEIMGINERTVRRHWTFAKAWLVREMKRDDGSA